MAVPAANWTQWTWLSHIRRLTQLGLRVRPVTPDAAWPPLARGDRILTVATDTVPLVIASLRAMYYRVDNQSDEWTRIGWEDIDHTSWHPSTGILTLTRIAAPPVTLRLTRPGQLPDVIRDRVAAAVTTTSVVDLDPGAARITLRRQPGTDALNWTVQLPGDLDPADPVVRHRVDQAVRRLRRDLGA